MCTCTIDIASESLNLSYNCVYFFSRAGPPNSLSRRASGGSPRPRIARAARGFLYAAVIAVRLAMAGMGPRPPLATSTRGRPHQAAPACAPQQQVQPNRSTAQPQFRHRPTTQGQLRHCGPPWLHGGTIPAPNRCARPAQGRCARASARQRLPPTQPQVCSGRNAMCWCPALARRGRHRPAQPWHAYMNQYQQ